MYHLILDLAMFSVLVKAITIGSDFNFYHWIRYGKEYTKWYNRTSRPKFMDRIDPDNAICKTCGSKMIDSGFNRLEATYLCPTCNNWKEI